MCDVKKTLCLCVNRALVKSVNCVLYVCSLIVHIYDIYYVIRCVNYKNN